MHADDSHPTDPRPLVEPDSAPGTVTPIDSTPRVATASSRGQVSPTAAPRRPSSLQRPTYRREAFVASPYASDLPPFAVVPAATTPMIARASRVLGLIVATLGVVIVILYVRSGIDAGLVGASPAPTLPPMLAFLGFVPLVLAIVFGHIGVRRSRALGVSTASARSGLRLGYLSLLAAPSGVVLCGALAGILAAAVG